METGKIKLRHAKETNVKSIIELQAQLDGPSPKDRYETNKFRKLVESYIQSNYTKDTHGIILAMIGSKIIGMVSFVLLQRLDQPHIKFKRWFLILSLVKNSGYKCVLNDEVASSTMLISKTECWL